MEFRYLIITGILTMLFLYASVNVLIGMSADNNVNNTLLENPVFNESFGDIQDNLEAIKDTAEEQRTATEEDVPTENSNEIPLWSATKMIKSYGKLIRNSYDLTFGLISKTLGVDPIIINVIFGIILITIVLLFWSFLRSGR